MDSSNAQITLALDDISLSISPAIGCSISDLKIKHNQCWLPILRSMPSQGQSASDAGSFVMLPWTNRIKDAKFSFEGKEHKLESNADDQTAIHGVGRNLPWAITDRSPITARFVLDSRLHSQINFPFKFGAIQRFEIGPKSVEIELSITNLDEHPIPVGCGHHPYIHRHLASPEDELSIKLDVKGRYPTQGCIPTGASINDDTCKALATGEPIGNPGLDDVFSGFGGDAIFDWDQTQLRMTMSCSSNMDHLVIYTPQDADGTPSEFVCVEPVTMVNDGFNAFADGNEAAGTVVLAPNETLRTKMTLSFEDLAH